MSKKSEFTGRTRSASRTGTRKQSSPKQETAGIASETREHQKSRKESKYPGTRVVVYPPVDPGDVSVSEVSPSRTRSNPIVYEAMDLLRTYGYQPARMSEPTIPINIIGMKENGSLLIFALRSRLPVPSAAKLRELYTAKVNYLRRMAGKVKERIMIWVYSPACGWRYYIVYPGGLRYDLDFPKSIE